MNPLKPISVLLFLLLSSIVITYAQATDEPTENIKAKKQYNNSIKLLTGDFFTPNATRGEDIRPINQIGIYYERRIYKNLHAGFGYAQWEKWNMFTRFGLKEYYTIPEYKVGSYTPIIGQLDYRSDYKMLDFYGFYKYHLSGRRHYLNIGLGLSYCWGLNFYLEYMSPPHSGINDGQISFLLKNEHYYGLIPSISYDYLLLKNRLNIGLDTRARYYWYRPKPQYDISIHAGVNF